LLRNLVARVGLGQSINWCCQIYIILNYLTFLTIDSLFLHLVYNISSHKSGQNL